MAGLIGTLVYKPCTTQVVQQNGYVHIADISGGALCYVDARNPDGQWRVSLRYYLSYADFQTDPRSYLNINDPSVPSEFFIPYVPNSGPVQSALVQLGEWWSQLNGQIVP